MPIVDLFSKRQARLKREGKSDPFVYDEIPQTLRVQIVHLWRQAIGDINGGEASSNIYRFLNDTLCEEYGVFKLADGRDPEQTLVNFFMQGTNIERYLDIIELSFQAIDRLTRETNFRYFSNATIQADQAIENLNARFLEHGIGYQFESGELIRKDSEFLHAEVIKPALALLQDERYQGANEEFLKAHEYYRKGETKDCLVYCLKALESTLKTICQIRSWPYKKTDTAKSLIDLCFQNDLVPNFLQSHYSALKSTLESGVPTVRNKLGGHGQGAEVVTVPPHYGAYMLHMTGSSIHFLVEAEKELK